MKLFRKKKEEEKLGYKLGHNLFGELWESKRERSLVLLVLWFFFIMLVIIFINNSSRTVKKPLYKDPKDLLNELVNYQYDLTVTNSVDNSFTYYNGNINNGIDTGVKKINDEEINYKIVNNIAYDENMNIIEYPYYDISLNVFNYLVDYESKLLDNKIMTYIYNVSYNNEIIKVYLKTTYDKITIVRYDYLDYSYTINLSY